MINTSAKNPFVIGFGKLPSQYIHRDLIIDEIISELVDSDGTHNPCFMLTGARGTGKTVTMTAIEQKIEPLDDWVIVRLNPARNMLESLVAKLYDSKSFIHKFIDAGVNLSKFGIGINLETTSPVADIESALEIILREVKRKGKKVLVTIDEVSNTEYMREFASSFQILIREDMPIYLIMAGLYDNIRNLKDQKDLTFLYRTPLYDMEPLNLTLIAQSYMQILGVDQQSAFDMAIVTKGYPFAYQALGRYLWEEEGHKMSDNVLLRFDEALKHYVYDKIWSELSRKDKWFMSFIVQKENISTGEVLKASKQKQNEFSQYRSRLKDKGLIDVATHGVISIVMPRFDVFVKNEILINPVNI